MHSVQQPSNIPEPTYEVIAKPDNDDDVNMEKNPAYSVQDTSVLHHYDLFLRPIRQRLNSKRHIPHLTII